MSGFPEGITGRIGLVRFHHTSPVYLTVLLMKDNFQKVLASFYQSFYRINLN